MLGVASIAEGVGVPILEGEKRKSTKAIAFTWVWKSHSTLGNSLSISCSGSKEWRMPLVHHDRGASWLAHLWASSKDGLLSSLLGEDGSWLVLGIWVVCQLWWAWRYWTLEDGLLEVIEDSRVLLGDKGDSDTTLASSSCSSNAVNVIYKQKEMKSQDPIASAAGSRSWLRASHSADSPAQPHLGQNLWIVA